MSENTSALYHPHPDFVQQAHISGMDAYHALCEKAEKDYPGYWADLAREYISWKKPFTKSLNDTQAPFFKWFEDGLLNVSYNCLDRHLGTPTENRDAIIFESDDGKVNGATCDDENDPIENRKFRSIDVKP